MQRKNLPDESLDTLLEVARELADIIEDNNQNIKDCHKVLKRIEEQVCPPKGNVVTRAFLKLLNKCAALW